jgi:uncharacterized protein (DUF4415 family)
MTKKTMAKRGGSRRAKLAAGKSWSSTPKGLAERGASYRPARPRVRKGSDIGSGDQLKTDWERFDRQTDEDIRKAIASDPYAAPELDDNWFRGANLVDPIAKKVQMTIRIDQNVYEWFKKLGKGYQTRMNAVLRTYVEAQQARKPKIRKG